MAPRTLQAAAGLLVLAALTSCSVPRHGAVRLNEDGTVDYVVCFFDQDPIGVDYLVGEDTTDHDDWHATPGTDDAHTPDVIRYGVVPAGYTEDIPAGTPPPGWTSVSTPGGHFDRDDLTIGEWFWNSGTTWAWIPKGHTPCSGYEIGPDGDPRQVDR